jgi:hypothetical protein
MSHTDWNALAPYLAPYFDFTLRDHGVFERFWIAEDGFSIGRSFGTTEEATADVKSRLRAGVQYQIYDDCRSAASGALANGRAAFHVPHQSTILRSLSRHIALVPTCDFKTVTIAPSCAIEFA